MSSPTRPAAPLRRTLARAGSASGLAIRAAPVDLAAFLAFTMIAAGLPVLIAWLTRSIVDGLVHGAPFGTLIGQAVALAGAGLLAGGITAGSRYLRGAMERAVGMLARGRLFTAVNHLVGLARFEDPVFLDRLWMADESSGRMPNQAVDGAVGVASGIVTVVGFLGSLTVLSPLMAGFVLLSGAPVLLAELALSKQRARMMWEISPAQRRELFYRQLLSSAKAAKEVRLFGLGTFLRARMLTELRAANDAKRRMDRRELRTQAGLGVFSALVSGAGLVWAVYAARSGRLSVGSIALFIAAVVGVQTALRTVAQEVSRAHEALLLFDHYTTVVRGAQDLPVAPRPRSLPPLRQGIELRDVWFRYSDAHDWVLRGVDLTIPSGQAVGLVGLNGAGKSTLVKLLCRFYDPTRGAVYWDGVDLRAVAPEVLRARISAVFQDYMDYDLTAAENIGVGDLEALHDRPRIEAAARRAGVHDTVRHLPQGYDTMLSRLYFGEADKDDPETGVYLSGGQRQRIALARALLRESRDLVILDEPSAGLDAEAEHEIHTRLAEHRAGLTSLLISHRLSAVRSADRIVVLSGGRVVEQADHDTLMATGGEYARLFTLQASGYQLEADAAVGGAGSDVGSHP